MNKAILTSLISGGTFLGVLGFVAMSKDTRQHKDTAQSPSQTIMQPTSRDWRYADTISNIVGQARNSVTADWHSNKDSVRTAELSKLLKNRTDLFVKQDSMFNENNKLEKVPGTFIYTTFPESKATHLVAKF